MAIKATATQLLKDSVEYPAARIAQAATITALKAVTGMSDEEVRMVPGSGTFRYDSSSTSTADDVAVVAPTVGSGRWILDGVNLARAGTLELANYASVAAMISDAASDQKTLIVRPGTHSIASSVTFPSTVAVEIKKGAMLQPASGQTVTINGPVSAGLYQIFDTSAGGSFVLADGVSEKVPVQWFGAAGDGTTDDTTPVNKALNAGKNIYFPPGTYVTGAIDASGLTDKRILGAGMDVTTLKLKPSTAEAVIELSETSYRVSIESLSIDGNRTNQSPSGDGTHYGILMAGRTISVSDVYIKDCATDGIILNTTDSIGGYSLHNVVMDNSRRNGLSVIQGVNFSAVNCAFINTAGVAPLAGVDIEPSGAQTARNISFTDCRFEGNAGDGITIGLAVSVSATIRDIRITGGIARSNTGRGIRVLKYDVYGVAITGVQCELNAKAGILTDNAHVRLVACECIDNDSGAADTAGIVVTADRCTVLGCTSRNNDTTNQAYGISITGTGTNALVLGNDLQGNATGVINDSGGSTTRLHNVGDGTLMKRVLTGSFTWDPNSMADGAITGTSQTVTGAAVGDPAIASLTTHTSATATISAHVIAADTVRVVIFNKTGGVYDPASGTLRIAVFKF